MTSSRDAAPPSIEQLCLKKGVRLTPQRRAVAQALAVAHHHPGAQDLLDLVRQTQPRISMATVYRTLRQFEAAGVIERQTFGGRVGKYDVGTGHHDHLVDADTGEMVEFSDETLEKLQRIIARRLGYRLVDHRLTLVGRRVPELSSSGGAERQSAGEPPSSSSSRTAFAPVADRRTRSPSTPTTKPPGM